MRIDTTLNAVITLFFTYLILSLMTSVLLEFVAGVFNSRGRALRLAIGQLLNDPGPTGMGALIYNQPLIKGLSAGETETLFTGGLLDILRGTKVRLPSYISPDLFADALTSSLRLHNNFPSTPPTNPALAALWSLSGNSEAVFRTKVMEWYQGAMDRGTGSYKRSSQRWLLIFGLVLAVVLNVDTIALSRYLMDPANREAVSTVAQSLASKMTELDSKVTAINTPKPDGNQGDAEDVQKAIADIRGLNANLQELKLPIGWDTSALCTSKPEISLSECITSRWGRLASMVLGWFFTALAISLGSQFWFDTLGKIIKLRSAGPRPI
jgi:hypothetical protein